jgi:hypothetical protein
VARSISATRLSRRILLSAAVLQVAIIGFLLAGGPEMLGRWWDWFGRTAQRLQEVGGLATVPLALCIVALGVSVVALALDGYGPVRLSRRGRLWAERGLRYTGRIAWMLGLLQTLLSLYAVRWIFAAEMPYQETVSRLGDISGAAYGSSLIGGGTLLVGWLAQLLLTGRMED